MKFVYSLLLFLVALVGIGFILVYTKNSRMPDNLGVKNGRLAEVPSSPNAVSSQTADKEKKVEPFPFKGSLEESKTKIKDIVESYGGAEIITEKDDYLHIVFTTGKMKFHDDAEFYFDVDKEVVEFRSASRAGYSDMGLNKERYLKLRELYEEK